MNTSKGVGWQRSHLGRALSNSHLQALALLLCQICKLLWGNIRYSPDCWCNCFIKHLLCGLCLHASFSLHQSQQHSSLTVALAEAGGNTKQRKTSSSQENEMEDARGRLAFCCCCSCCGCGCTPLPFSVRLTPSNRLRRREGVHMIPSPGSWDEGAPVPAPHPRGCRSSHLPALLQGIGAQLPQRRPLGINVSFPGYHPQRGNGREVPQSLSIDRRAIPWGPGLARISASAAS